MDGREDTFDAFLSSDWHWDHPDCDRALLRRHLDDAVRRHAPIFAFGDIGCLMQGPHDKRATKGATRPEHNRIDYFNAVAEDLAGELQPWGDHIALLSKGNHETAVERHNGVDILKLVAHELRQCGADNIGVGGYAGYVRFRFTRGSGGRESVRLCYHHGSGGSAPASRGTLKINRRIVAADADVYVEGHDHNRWAMPEMMHRLNDANVIVPRQTLHVRTGSYKAAGGVAESGWETEKGMGLRPLGGYFLRFWYDGDHIQFGATDPMPERAMEAA